MKKSFSLFLMLNCAFSFAQLDSLQKKRWEEINKRFEEQCTRDSNIAVEDSKTQNIYYINTPAPNGEDFLPSNELTEILKPYGIKFGGTWMGSDIAGYYTDSLCYKSTMTRIAKDKFGEKFFEEKKQEALELFIKNNPDKIFDYRIERIKFSENNFEIDFWKSFKLPKDYIKSNEGSSKVYAFFTIDKNGKAENIDLETDFKIKSNSKFKKQILSSIKNKITKYKWKPNTYKGFAVKSLQSITITFP